MNEETLKLIEDDVKSKVSNLMRCDFKELPDAFRKLNESVQSYCTFKTLLNKYNNENSSSK